MTGSSSAPKPAGCLLCLLQTSASMGQPWPTGKGGLTRLQAARLHLNQLLDRLVRAVDSDFLLAGLQVGILGFGGGHEAALVSLLPGAGRMGVQPLEVLACVEVSDRDGVIGRRLAVDQTSHEENAATMAALIESYSRLVTWMAATPDARPPVLLLCADETPEQPQRERLRCSLKLLGTASGTLRLAQALYRDDCPASFLVGPEPPQEEGFRRAWAECSPVYDVPLQAGPISGRALAINAPLQPIVEELLLAEVPASLLEPPAPGSCRMNVVSTQKRGNRKHECEDGARKDEDRGLAVICDGAGEGIFTQRWVAQLLDSYMIEKPDVTDRTTLIDWVKHCRQTWQSSIRFAELRGYQQTKVLDVGAGGTFLVWELGAPAMNGALPWRAWAIGDACLFWVRRGHLLATFPLVHWGQFGLTPNLLLSRPNVTPPAPVFAFGDCLPGDQFFLATDATAKEMLRCVAEGQNPPWDELLAISERDWEDRIGKLREAQRIDNDDCTLLSIEVTGAPVQGAITAGSPTGG